MRFESDYLAFLGMALLAPALFAGDPTDAEKLFALKVKPLFAENCFACHGEDPDKIKGEFVLYRFTHRPGIRMIILKEPMAR